MLPAIVLVQAEANLDKWPPLRPLGLANQMKPGFLRRPISFERIAIDARANNIFPGRWPTPVPRDNVVQIQILPVKSFPAILASVLIPFEDVMPGELHLFLWKMIINHQQNNAWDTNPEGDGANRFRMRFLLGKIMPFAEAEGLKRAVRAIEDNLGMALKQQR
jgi:hypothetical protein